VRVIQTAYRRGRAVERVLIDTDDADLARIVAFVHGTAARKGTVTSVEGDDGETTHAEIATRAHRFKTPTHKAYRENRTRVAE
jgi:hypothetical protein